MQNLHTNLIIAQIVEQKWMKNKRKDWLKPIKMAKANNKGEKYGI